jgi:DNA-binding NtrC family response regulator
MLRAYRWPGNVRELQNAVQRMLINPARTLNVSARSSTPPPSMAALTDDEKLEPLRINRRSAADEFERSYLKRVLARADGNVTRAAAIAEVSRQMIQKLMKKHDL